MIVIGQYVKSIGLNQRRGVIALTLLVLFSSACVRLVERPSSVPWHTIYQPINDPEAIRFLNKGIELLQETHGSPDIPVNKVYLRYSFKNSYGANYRVATGFSKTEIVNRKQGIFCIYLPVPPGNKRFYYLLGHEIGHLLHPDIVDCASEERFCNDFSRRLCNQESQLWSKRWETRDWVRKK